LKQGAKIRPFVYIILVPFKINFIRQKNIADGFSNAIFPIFVSYFINSMSNNSQDQIYSKNVIEVITIANEVCIFLEEIDKYEKQFICLYLQKILPLLYLKGALLPDVQVSSDEANDRFVTQEQWESVYDAMKKILGKDDSFLFINYITKQNDEPEKGSIAEFLADIYQDLKDFLLLYQKNTLASRENAVHSCKVLFEEHWGEKLINIHKAIHILLYGKRKGSNQMFTGFSAN
jgi:hypothetical protein